MGARNFALIIVLILLAAIAVLASFDIKNPKPKSGFTELYFSGPLPKDIKLGKEYNFSFAVHNLENRNVLYNYAVYVKSDALRRGNLSLDHDQTAFLSQAFNITRMEDAPMPITVRLLNKEQEIHFWVNAK